MLTCFSSVGPFLLKKFNPKLILLFGGSLILGSFFGASYVQNEILFIFLFGVFPGIGSGICYLVPVACIWEYFPEKKGCVTGIVIGGFGLSVFIFSFIVQTLFNPHNLSPDLEGGYFSEHVASRAMFSIRVLVLIWAIIFLTGLMLVRLPEQVLYKYYGRDYVHLMAQAYLVQQSRDQDQKIRVEIKTCKFWTLYSMLFLSIFYGLFLINAFKNFGLKTIDDDFFLNITGGVAAVFNGLSRPFWSSLLDCFSFKRVYGIFLVIQILLSATIYFTRHQKYVYLIFVVASQTCEGGHFTMFPTVCGQIFGLKTGAKMYGILMTSIGLSALATAFANKYLGPVLGYLPLFLAGCLLTLLSLSLLICFKESPKFRKIKYLII